MTRTTAFTRLAASTALALGMFGLSAGFAPAAQAGTNTATFGYTGGAQSFTVPSGVTAITVEAWGGQGGNGNVGAVGGRGAYIRSTLGVSAGQALSVYVGGQGGTANRAAGFNGGGTGGSSAGGGGGGSDVRLGSTRLVVAGGGGGAAANDYPPYSYGGASGEYGGDGGDGNGTYLGYGGDGAITSGGAGGAGGGSWWMAGSSGTVALGGAGGDDGGNGRGGGGGGGGYHGGGGGAAAGTNSSGGGGGGGSSFSSGTSTTYSSGIRSGNGQVVVTYFQPQCSDGVDNDGDGRTDYPADPGCANSQDDSEGVPCTTTAGVTTCVGLEAGAEIQQFTVYEPGVYNGPHDVAGYVDSYRFDTPGGGSVVLPCVVLVLDGATVDPCDTAGGTFVSRLLVLVDLDVPEVSLGGALLTVRICAAELVATVNGLGVTSQPAYAIC